MRGVRGARGCEGQARGAGERGTSRSVWEKEQNHDVLCSVPRKGVLANGREREREMDAWIAQDKKYTPGRGVEGKLGELLGAGGPDDTCIEDMGEVGGYFEGTEDAEREHEQGGLSEEVQTAAAVLGGYDNEAEEKVA